MTLAERRHSLHERRLALLQRGASLENIRQAQRPKSMVESSSNLFDGCTIATPIKLDGDIGSSIKLNLSKNGDVTLQKTNISANVESSAKETSEEIVDGDGSEASAKSLADIKSRINAIKARREQLSKIKTGVKNDTLVVTQ